MAAMHGWSREKAGARSSSLLLGGPEDRERAKFMNTQPMEILLVEDNEDDIVLEQEALAEAKLVNIMHVVRDGEQAMAYLQRQGQYHDAKIPGMILLDINMPKKNGFEVLKEIKADAGLRHIPVVMLTTSENERDIVKSYAKGACSFITKPMDFDKFGEVIKQFALYWALVARVPSTQR